MVTVIETICADGSQLLPMIIFKEDGVQESCVENSDLCIPNRVLVGYSEIGGLIGKRVFAILCTSLNLIVQQLLKVPVEHVFECFYSMAIHSISPGSSSFIAYNIASFHFPTIPYNTQIIATQCGYI